MYACFRLAAYSHSLFPESTASRCTVSLSTVKLLSCLIAMHELRRPYRCSVTQSSGMRGIGHWATGREAARYRPGTGQPTWQNLRKAKIWQDPLRADTRRSLREALCAEETEAGSGGAASELDGGCTAAFAGTQRTIHFTSDVCKHLSAKAHLLYIEVLEGSETSLLPPGFGKKLAAKGVPTIVYGPPWRVCSKRLHNCGNGGTPVSGCTPPEKTFCSQARSLNS